MKNDPTKVLELNTDNTFTHVRLFEIEKFDLRLRSPRQSFLLDLSSTSSMVPQIFSFVSNRMLQSGYRSKVNVIPKNATRRAHFFYFNKYRKFFSFFYCKQRLWQIMKNCWRIMFVCLSFKNNENLIKNKKNMGSNECFAKN